MDSPIDEARKDLAAAKRVGVTNVKMKVKVLEALVAEIDRLSPADGEDPLTDAMKKARSLALTVLDAGLDMAQAFSQMRRWHIPQDMADAAVQWAKAQQGPRPETQPEECICAGGPPCQKTKSSCDKNCPWCNPMIKKDA